MCAAPNPGPRAARGARRTRARAPRARDTASRPAPGARGDRSPAARAPTRPPPARMRSSSIHDRGRPQSRGPPLPRPCRRRTRSRCRRAVRAAAPALPTPRRPRSARSPAAPACRRSPGARTRPRRGARPSVPPASARTRPAGRRGRTARPSGGTDGPAAESPARTMPRWPRSAARASPRASACPRARPRRSPERPSPGARHERHKPVAPASTPSPVRALTSIRGTPGWTWSRWYVNLSRSKSRCGSRSILLTITSSQARNISGYLSGLSSPSVTDETITRTSSPTRNSAGQTRLPTFSITSRSISASGSAGSAERTMFASR